MRAMSARACAGSINCEERGREVRDTRLHQGVPARGWTLGATGLLCAASLLGAVGIAQASTAGLSASTSTASAVDQSELTSADAVITDVVATSDASVQTVRLTPSTVEAKAGVARFLGDDGYAYYFEFRPAGALPADVLVTAVPQRLPAGSPERSTVAAVRYVLTQADPDSTLPSAVVADGVGGVIVTPGVATAGGVGTPLGSSATFGSVAVDLGTMSGSEALLNVTFPATRLAATTPSAPQAVRGQWRESTNIAVTWAVPDNPGGAVITHYTATVTPGGLTCTATRSTECVVSGVPVLAGDQRADYSVTVRAHNAVGTSPESGATSLATDAGTSSATPTAAPTSALAQMAEVTVADAEVAADTNTASAESTTAVMAPMAAAAVPAETVVPTYDPFATSGSTTTTTTADPYATTDPYASTTPYTTTTDPYAATTTTTTSTLAATGAGSALTWLAAGAMIIVAGSTLVVASRMVPARARHQAKHRSGRALE